MAVELHILGPAFGLASVDAECLAAVALIQLRLPSEFRLIPTHTEQDRLPLLVDSGKRVYGFNNIARHLHVKGSLSPDQRANAIALTSFLQARAQTLLDISLYVSFENYSTTRSAFTKLLPWYANYIVPPQRRAAARQRTQHLGISSIDVDNVHESMGLGDGVGKEEGKLFEAETQKRASLLLPRKDTISSLLLRPGHSAVFKLHILADNFFEPMQEMLRDRDHLLGGSELSAVDCLAYGYLALMLYANVPQDWLAATLRTKYANLVAYVERIHNTLNLYTKTESVLSMQGLETDASREDHRHSDGMSLPWSVASSSSFVTIITSTVAELVSHIPLIAPSSTTVTHTRDVKQPSWHRYLPTILGLSTGVVGLTIYLALRTGNLIWPHGEEIQIFGRKRLADYGHLGAALAGISMMSQQARKDASYHA
ncbi:metaxin-like protein [Teratosphaeria destructans]|uniref:Metaxin-like protein n=1 Tax=Teratosphaeria destructans TaxID=418781 RepID=A0A9W7SQL4_9PEZI|nr:metaxin-like protein [Teratosphaeria destructans]